MLDSVITQLLWFKLQSLSSDSVESSVSSPRAKVLVTYPMSMDNIKF